MCILLAAPHRCYPHLIVVVGFGCSWDPESYTGSSVASGRATQAGQVKGRRQTKRDTLVLQVGVWAWDWQPHSIKIKLFRNREEGQGSLRTVVPVMMMMIIIIISAVYTNNVLVSLWTNYFVSYGLVCFNTPNYPVIWTICLLESLRISGVLLYLNKLNNCSQISCVCFGGRLSITTFETGLSSQLSVALHVALDLKYTPACTVFSTWLDSSG
jgi:hypothetical protein